MARHFAHAHIYVEFSVPDGLRESDIDYTVFVEKACSQLHLTDNFEVRSIQECGECDSGPTPAQQRLYAAHQQEAHRVGAVFWNLGWVQTDTSICSKTSAGILETIVNVFGHPDFLHTWS